MKNHQITQRQNIRKALIMATPAFVLLAMFFIGPALITVMYSMTNMTLTGSAAQNVKFVGLQNFQNLFKSRDMSTVVYNTMMFLLWSGIIGQQVLGLVLALLLKRKARGVKMFVGFTVTSGWITPEAVAIIMCSCLFDSKGTINTILGVFGIEPIRWLMKYSLVSIILSNIWKGCAYSMMMMQAALDNVPDDLMEAAKIDGANYLQSLFRITIPLIKDTLATNFMIITLGTLGTTGLIYGLTGGGPGNTSTTLSILMYKKSFVSFQIGYGMAISLIILVLGIVLSLVYTKLLNRKEKLQKL